MAGHITPLAKAVRDAIVSSTNLKAAVDAVYAELGTITTARHADVGPAGEQVVFLPGYGPLSDPRDYVHISMPV